MPGPRAMNYPADVAADLDARVAASDNGAALQSVLAGLASGEDLCRFLYAFVVFNDALAARVPYLTGLIHLEPGLFRDRQDSGLEFCSRRNGRIAAWIATAAADEYQMDTKRGRNLVHQHLSQQFLVGALEHFRLSRTFEAPTLATDVIHEARSTCFEARTEEHLFRALGFHLALEIFAHQEFNLVDRLLRERYPDLVRDLRARKQGGGVNSYAWISIHTVVEHGHYEAGVKSVEDALRLYAGPRDANEVWTLVCRGFEHFIGLQRRFYGLLDERASSRARRAPRSALATASHEASDFTALDWSEGGVFIAVEDEAAFELERGTRIVLEDGPHRYQGTVAWRGLSQRHQRVGIGVTVQSAWAAPPKSVRVALARRLAESPSADAPPQ